MLKFLGALFMLIDHIGFILFPELTILRVIGRIAFPLFAYQVTISYKKTKDLKTYCKRLFIWGLISQIPFSLVFGGRLNVMFTFFVGSIAIYLFNRFQGKLLKYASLVVMLGVAQFFNVDYGAYGVFIVFIFHILPINLKLFALLETASLIYALKYNFMVQVFSPLSLLILNLKFNFDVKLPKYFFYVFYPSHILILWIIKKAL